MKPFVLFTVLITLISACGTIQSPPPTATAIAFPSPTRLELPPPASATPTRAVAPSIAPAFNPFANLTADQQACLRKAWGDEAFNAITTSKRPPLPQEAPALGQCGVPPPPGAATLPAPNQTIAADTARPCLPDKRIIGIPDPDGPSFHQVLMAHSSDGINWQADGKVIIDQASVPEGVRFNDGRLAIYAVDGSGYGGPGLVYAESKDDGKTWSCSKVNFTQVGADPDIVVLSDGRLRMFTIMFPFTGAGQPPNPGQNTKPNSVNSAVSSDGKNWTIESGSRLEGINYTDPDVIRVGNEWFMYVSTGPLAWAAKSSDGRAFELIGKVNESGAVSGSYVFPDGKIRHYYCGNSGIESAVSDTGGSAWKKEAGTRITRTDALKSICDPSILSDGKGGYIMIYKVQPK